jgi:hypothetical protein
LEEKNIGLRDFRGNPADLEGQWSKRLIGIKAISAALTDLAGKNESGAFTENPREMGGTVSASRPRASACF